MGGRSASPAPARAAPVDSFAELCSVRVMDAPPCPSLSPHAVRTIDIKGSGAPLDAESVGSIVKPGELVDIVEITPLNRNDQMHQAFVRYAG